VKRYKKLPRVMKSNHIYQGQRLQWKRYAMGVLKSYLGGCVDCGFNGSSCALDFDHKPEFKKSKIVSQMGSFPWHSILSEMAKCDLVCANCHRIRTKTRHKNNV